MECVEAENIDLAVLNHVFSAEKLKEGRLACPRSNGYLVSQ